LSPPFYDRIGRKGWTDEEVQKYIGPYRSVALTYAEDERMRRWAASGGTTTALLAYLLESGRIDGAMVVKGWVDHHGKVQAEFVIATTREELLEAQGSKYQAVRFGKRELSMIASFPGRLAFVLLPCDATKLAGARRRRPEVDDRVALVIALYCGHNSEPELVQSVVERIGEGHGQLTDFHYRSGHWRGVLTATYEDGSTLVRPHNQFKNHHNLYFYSQPKCNHCFDHFGYDCDLSVGDIWTLSMRRHPIKHTAVITRSELADELLGAAVDDGVLRRSETDVRDILDGQARTLPFHYNVTARARVGKLFGLKIQDPVREPVRLVDLVVAFLIMLNQQISKRPLGRRVIKALPTPIVRAYLLFIKALEQL
jgi:coenzyme F420 hydrogenase subunit beta